MLIRTIPVEEHGLAEDVLRDVPRICVRLALDGGPVSPDSGILVVDAASLDGLHDRFTSHESASDPSNRTYSQLTLVKRYQLVPL